MKSRAPTRSNSQSTPGSVTRREFLQAAARTPACHLGFHTETSLQAESVGFPLEATRIPGSSSWQSWKRDAAVPRAQGRGGSSLWRTLKQLEQNQVTSGAISEQLAEVSWQESSIPGENSLCSVTTTNAHGTTEG